MHSESPDRILRKPEVINKTGRSSTTIWRDVRKGLFPAPIEIGPNAVGWWASEIEAWLASRPRVPWASSGDVPSGPESSKDLSSGHARTSGPCKAPPGRSPPQTEKTVGLRDGPPREAA